MSSKSRHRKPSVDFVAKAQQFSSSEERLSSAEHSLFERERGLDINQRPRMFFEMGISPDELDWISAELGEGITEARKKGFDETRLLDRFSRLTVAAMVNAGHHTSRDNSFWPVFWEQLDIPESNDLAGFIRRRLRTWMQNFHLDVFDGVKLGSSEYVTRATLHAGIPTAEMRELVAHSKELLIHDDDPDDGDREGKLLVQKYIDEQSPRTLYRLSNLKPSLASYLFARVVEYVHYSQSTKDWYTNKDFEGTNGLPESTFGELRQFLLQGEDNSANLRTRARVSAQEQPHLRLDPDAGKVVLVLPAVPDEGEDLTWIVDAESDTFHIEPRIDNSSRQFHRHEVTLSSPARQIRVTQSITQQTFVLPFLGSDFPVAFFGSDFHYCEEQQQISRSNLFALAPVNTRFADVADEFTGLVSEELQFISWNDWRVYSLENLLESRALTIRIPATSSREARSTTRGIRSLGTRGPEWHLDVATVADAIGSDMGVVYSQSPQVSIPHDDAEWAFKISYMSPEGEKSTILEYEGLEELAGEKIQIFDDSYSEAWVGHFKVEILKDGLVVSQKFFNIAEGFQTKVSYGSTQTFRAPSINVASNSYSKVYYEAECNLEKPIGIPFSGTRSVGDTDESAAFTVSSPEGFELEIQLVPKMMRFSIDRTDVPHSWNTFPSVVPSEHLDPSGHVKVQFPHRIDGSVFLLAADSRAQRKLVRIPMQARRNRQLFAVPISELSSAFNSANVELTLSVGWYVHSAKRLWKEQNDTRHRQKAARNRWGSLTQFEKQYNAFDLNLYAPPSTIMQLSSSAFSGTAEIQGKKIVLHGTLLGKNTLRGYLWPLTDANRPPFAVSFDADKVANLPDVLTDAGPLALELTTESKGYQAPAPKAPTDRALVVPQAGYFIAPDKDKENLFGLSFKLSGIGTPGPVRPNEFVDLWERLAPLQNISLESEEARRGAKHIERLCEYTFAQDPRSVLEALGRTNVRVEHQVSLAIQYGLFSSPFSNQADTLNDFHPVPWVGVLGELNDLVTISASRMTSQKALEFSESLQYVEEIGGSALTRILSGDAQTEQSFVEKVIADVGMSIMLNDLGAVTTGLTDISAERLLVDEAAIRHGWSEMIRNRAEIERIPKFSHLIRLAQNLAPNIGSPEVKDYATRLWDFAIKNSDSNTNTWVWVPFISIVLAHASRAHAHGINGLHEPFLKHLPGSLRRWAKVARLCPTLTTNDLLREDARQLVAKTGPLPQIQSV